MNLLNIKSGSETVKSLKLNRGKELFSFTFEIRCSVKNEREKSVFPHYFEFSQTSTSVYITYGNTGKNVFYFFYKITRRKLKRGNSFLYQSVNSPYCS